MSNNKQTSIDFYAKAEKDLSDRFSKREVNYTQYREKKSELLQQAKAMHEEEIIDAHTVGYVIGGGNGDLHELKEYYKERFGEQL